VATALKHEASDRTPLDTSVSYPFYLKLKKALGIESFEELLKMLGVDIRWVGAQPSASFRRKAVHNPYFHYGWGKPLNDKTIEDEWGIRRTLVSTGLRSRVTYHPLQHMDIDEYSPPDPDDETRYDNARRAASNYLSQGFFVAGGLGCDLFFSQAWYLRGFTRLLVDMYRSPEYVERLFDKLLDYYVRTSRKIVEVGVHCIAYADDIAWQYGPIIPPDMFKKHYLPRLTSLINQVKKRNLHVFFHSDGDIKAFINHWVTAGIDIINPVQPECVDPVWVKKKYGHLLTMHGTLSIQKTLPHGTPRDIAREVKERIRLCGMNGGLILSPSNQVLEDTPIENFLEIYRTAKKIRLK